MVVCPVTFSLFPFFRFPMVVSNLFLWYDEGQDLFSERKKSAVSVSKCFEKEEKQKQNGGRNMKNTKVYVDFITEKLKKLLSIDSPTGYTKDAIAWLKAEYEAMGYAPVITTKGGLLVQLAKGCEGNGGVLVETHTDTLGGMVAEVKGNGRLRLTALGGMNPNNAETENCVVITRDGKRYEGCFQMNNPSIHVNGSYDQQDRTYDNMEVVLDEMVFSKEETKALGIETGDIVCFETRTRITEKGYIKSRFLDDKLSVAILLGYAKYLKEENITPSRPVYQHITVYEEVGHGGSASVPEGVTDILSVDMGCVGDGLECKEHQVSICVKDSGGPYSYDFTGELIAAAKANGIDYAADVYPHYGSDVEATLRGGADARHALIGAGVYASHGYERSHVDGVKNTLELLAAYLDK